MTVESQVLAITGLERKDFPDDHSFRFRCIVQIGKLDEETWNNLPHSVKAWNNAACVAHEKGTPLPAFSEEDAENERVILGEEKSTKKSTKGDEQMSETVKEIEVSKMQDNLTVGDTVIAETSRKEIRGKLEGLAEKNIRIAPEDGGDIKVISVNRIKKISRVSQVASGATQEADSGRSGDRVSIEASAVKEGMTVSVETRRKTVTGEVTEVSDRFFKVDSDGEIVKIRHSAIKKLEEIFESDDSPDAPQEAVSGDFGSISEDLQRAVFGIVAEDTEIDADELIEALQDEDIGFDPKTQSVTAKLLHGIAFVAIGAFTEAGLIEEEEDEAE